MAHLCSARNRNSISSTARAPRSDLLGPHSRTRGPATALGTATAALGTPAAAIGSPAIGAVTDTNSNSVIDVGDVIVFNFSEVVANKSTIETFLGGAQFGTSSSATAVWNDPLKKLEVTLGTSTSILDGDTVQFSVVEDLAGNQSVLQYTVDI